jgi:hypothetical protein
MPDPFDANILHWPTLEAFKAYLAGIPRPAWCKGITNHNSYIPNEATWYGIPSVKSCQKTYIGKGWSAGPHLFLAAIAPHPAHIGIFQLTPLSHQGIHAGACNADRLGIESVGDFDARPPTPVQYQLLLDVNRAILEAWGLKASTVNVHRECMPGRTCPGRHLTGAQIRADLNAPPLPILGRYRMKPVPIFQEQDGDGPIAGYIEHTAEHVSINKIYDNGMAHLADGRGFVRLSLMEKV